MGVQGPWTHAGEFEGQSPSMVDSISLLRSALTEMKMFYGWKVSWVGFLGNFFLQGGAIFIMNALIDPLTAAHGWTRGELSSVMAVASLAGTLSMPLLGTLALHCSLRWLMVAGALMGGLGFLMMGLTANIWLFTLAFSAVWVGGQACGGVIANALVCNWFFRYRGQAFGIVNMGTSMSGAVLPFTALLLIKVFALPVATAVIACAVLFSLLPLCVLLVRDNPEDVGQLPDGEAPLAQGLATPAAASQVVVVPWKDLLKNRDCYLIGLVYGIGIMVAAGVVGQLKPRFSDLGFADYPAMAFMSLAAFCGAMGKYFWGWLSDRLNPIRTTYVIIVCDMLGMGVAFLPSNVYTALLFAVYTGGCVGGFWAVFPNAVAHVFGRSRFVSVYRFTSAFVTIKALGYYIMGVIYDQTGSFDGAYLFFMASLVLAGVLLRLVNTTPDAPPPARV